MATNDNQTQTENRNTEITWSYVFKPFFTSYISIIVISIILELIKMDFYLPSVDIMLLELSINPISLVGQHLTTYLFILKILNKNVGTKKKYLDLFYSILIIKYIFYDNINDNYKATIFALRFIIHMITLSPISEITLDCITIGINHQIQFYTMENYNPTEGSIRLGLATILIVSTEISRFMYSLHHLIKNN